jgi:hypothetical protein
MLALLQATVPNCQRKAQGADDGQFQYNTSCATSALLRYVGALVVPLPTSAMYVTASQDKAEIRIATNILS